MIPLQVSTPNWSMAKSVAHPGPSQYLRAPWSPSVQRHPEGSSASHAQPGRLPVPWPQQPQQQHGWDAQQRAGPQSWAVGGMAHLQEPQQQSQQQQLPQLMSQQQRQQQVTHAQLPMLQQGQQ